MKISRAMSFHANIARSDNKLFLKSPGHFLRCFRLSIVTGSRIIRGEVNLWAGTVTFAMLLAGWVPSASEILWPSWHLSSSWFGYTVPMFKYTILEYNMPLHRWNYGSTKTQLLKICVWAVLEFTSIHYVDESLIVFFPLPTRTFQSQLAGSPPGGINQ